MTYEVFMTESGTGYGYRITSETGHTNIVQLYHPEKEGFVEMTQEEAEDLAVRYISSLEKTSTVDEMVPTIPVSEVKPTSQIGQVEFLARLTDVERKLFNRLKKQVEIDYTEAVKVGEVPETLDNIYDFLVLFDKASYVDLAFGPTITGVTYIGTALLGMTPERVAEILSY